METPAPVQKLSYSHVAMIDLLIANPALDQNALAQKFGYTPGWVSRIVRSDAFQEILAARKKELVDPLVIRSLEEKFDAVIDRSLEVILQKLDAAPSADMALKALGLTAQARGYGAKVAAQVNNTQVIVQVPGKAESAESWARAHKPAGPVIIVQDAGPELALEPLKVNANG